MNTIETKELETYIKSNSRVIAIRRLYYARKGSKTKHELIIRIYAPLKLDRKYDKSGCNWFGYACYVEFSGIHNGFIFYGYDAIQALELSASVDLMIREKKDEYDFYFSKMDRYSCYFDKDYDDFLESKIQNENNQIKINEY